MVVFANLVSHTPKSRGWLGSHSTYVVKCGLCGHKFSLGPNLIGSMFQTQMRQAVGDEGGGD